MIINPYTFATTSVSAPSAVNIDDAQGSDRHVSLVCGIYDSRSRRFTEVGTIHVENGEDTGTTFVPGFFGTVNAFRVRGYGTSTGDAPTSWSWGLTQTNSTGGVSITTGTTNTQDYEDQGFVVLDHSSASDDPEIRVSLTGTNSGGSTAAPNVDFTVVLS